MTIFENFRLKQKVLTSKNLITNEFMKLLQTDSVVSSGFSVRMMITWWEIVLLIMIVIAILIYRKRKRRK